MQNWKLSGIIATLIVVIALPVYMVRESGRLGVEKTESAPRFIGSKSCSKCHQQAYRDWQQSDHAKSMALANDKTVLADFDDAVFEKEGIKSRFFRKDGRFYVNTRGPNGKMADFEITYTFGWNPLQQYLVPFPGGRLQCLPFAWNTVQKKWFHLYPNLSLKTDERIYWTNQGQNWNAMCADCHSTNLDKNFNPATGTYKTVWSEINVGCEACHGPGSSHTAWAALPEKARRLQDDGLAKTGRDDNLKLVEVCAPCHSRMSRLGDYNHDQQHLLDLQIPRLLEEGLYFADGQIRDEVYVYGSFLQSKMYARGISCADCHNVHSGKLYREGNDLCLRCHDKAMYDNKSHHFHEKEDGTGQPIRDKSGKVIFSVGSGSLCVQCHMPGRYYMVNDYRPDHSIRIPRPDLSLKLDLANACNRCHRQKSRAWAAGFTEKWYGKRARTNFAETFSFARLGKSVAPQLIELVENNLSPDIVRASALALLSRYRGNETTRQFKKNLGSDIALLRRTALVNLPPLASGERQKLVGPLLEDPIKACRIAAAQAMMTVAPKEMKKRWREPFQKALAEYKLTALYSADFAPSRANLGALAAFNGNIADAEENLLKALKIDPDFYRAALNLAVLYSGKGDYKKAEDVLRHALARNNNLADVHYSLGLLLAEEKNFTEAAIHLRAAAAGLPANIRVRYNLGLVLNYTNNYQEAADVFLEALQIEPDNLACLQGLARSYLMNGMNKQAGETARQIEKIDPNNPFAVKLLNYTLNHLNKR